MHQKKLHLSKNLDFSIFKLQYDLRRNTFKEIAMD